MAASDWLSHNELKIIKGVFAAPGDANTVEPTIQTLNLIDNNSGVALTADGWMPGLPSIEGSGVWQDSPLDVGRRPLILQESNVTEKMQLNITGDSFSDVTKKMMLFTRMALDCRAFWTDNAQINPVYLKWWASCGAGPQYALLYNMEVDFQYMNSSKPAILATVTLEREPYWRAIPPGANPKQWTYEFLSSLLYDTTKATVFSADSLVANIPVSAKSEFSSSTCAVLISDNSVTIPANYIPGDAPALICMLATTDVSRPHVIIGKKTTKITQRPSVVSPNLAQNTIFNAADGTLGTDATRANDTGAVKAPGAANAQRVEISFATATNQLRWRSLSISQGSLNSANRFIGRWNIFLRCRQSAGAVGDITMYFRVSGASGVLTDTDGIKLNVVNPPVPAGGTGNSSDWGLVYMGVISLPIQNAKAIVNDGSFGTSGNGLTPTSVDTFDLGLFATRTAGVGLLYLNDVILIPIDEGTIQLTMLDSGGEVQGLIYDESGYFTHGTNEIFVANGPPASGTGGGLVQMNGSGIQLTPGVENKLYCINYDSSNLSRVTGGTTIYMGIVPRWRGIRDIKNVNG